LPELPEIEVIRRSLVRPLIGSQLRLVRMGPHDMRARGRGRGAPSKQWMTQGDLLHGARVKRLHRHGKQLAIEAHGGRVLVVQLGMSGQLLIETKMHRVRATHRHLEWEIVRGGRSHSTLVWRDPRRFGGVHAAPSLAALRSSAWKPLGVDALHVTPAQLAGILKGQRTVKALLLDQRAIAGVGNIYADEALFLARISPLQVAERVGADGAARLARALHIVLRKAIVRGGSTLRDHRSATGAAGKAQRAHAVYGRAGKSCVRCGGVLQSQRLAGRTTVWCPRCQPLRVSTTHRKKAGVRKVS
jgi:formamidopyrimidine-DNA glycosylase